MHTRQPIRNHIWHVDFKHICFSENHIFKFLKSVESVLKPYDAGTNMMQSPRSAALVCLLVLNLNLSRTGLCPFPQDCGVFTSKIIITRSKGAFSKVFGHFEVV